MEHKYVTCAGFGGTGSSVVSDIMAEFKTVKGCGDFEWTIAFDIDGISDLQHYIVDDFDKVKVTEGIYRFRRHYNIIAKSYSRNFNSDIRKIFDDYTDELVDVRWKGSNTLQVYRYSWFLRKCYRAWGLFRFYLGRVLSSNDGYERGLQNPKVLLELSHGEEKFFTATNSMYRKLLDSLDPDFKYDYLCFDQLVPIFRFKRYARYIPNLKIICVDRDPRDLYLLNEFYWHEGWIPSDDIDTYIKWFRVIRSDFANDLKEAGDQYVLAIKLEDAIYHYEETMRKICDFVGLKESDHIYKRQHFNPDYSKRNTKLWEKIDSKIEEIKRIETELSDYLYPY